MTPLHVDEPAPAALVGVDFFFFFLCGPTRAACSAITAPSSLAALDDGRLASGDRHFVIKIWDLTTNACMAMLVGHEDGDTLMPETTFATRALSPPPCLAVLEGGLLASTSGDGRIWIWEVATGACVATLTRHEHDVLSLAVLDGGRLASGSSDHTIKIWDSALSDGPP